MSGLFEKYSLLLSPTLPERELRIGAVMDDNRLDKYTVLGNLTSLPAISIPVGSNNIGLQFYSNKGEDAFLLNSIKIIYERD
jgi:Asp-tRNA(Asn)/Glu-tRNA(Gln) amidotransferase A subunit family amidase